MPTIEQWLTEYNESHQNKTNKLIHWLCVPAIAICVLGFANMIKLPFAELTLMHVIGALALTYYVFLSPKLGLGMFLLILAGFASVHILSSINIAPWITFLVIFVVSWIGQFYGHMVEGKRPSFFKDVQFLLIGPVWLLAAVYRKLDISY